jgi:hypothetical protein
MTLSLSVELPWTSDRLVAETCTCSNTQHSQDKRPCPRWDSNPQSLQQIGRRSSTGHWDRLKHVSPPRCSSNTALLVGGFRDQSSVVSLGIFSEDSDGTMCPGVDSASKNEYQDTPGCKDGRCVRVTTLPPS